MTSFGWNDIDSEKEIILENIETNKVHGGPFHAELDITNKCNLNCFFCNQGDLKTGKELSIGTIKSLLDGLVVKGLRSVRLSGGGEPLIHPHIREVFDYLNHQKVYIDNLTTNGLALEEWISDALIRNRARGITISLNASNPTSYAAMMQVSDRCFDQVIENIRYLVAKRKGSHSDLPRIDVQFIVYKENVRELWEMYLLGRDLRPDTITIFMMHNVGPSLLPGKKDRTYIVEQCREITKHAGHELKLTICLPGFFNDQNRCETECVPDSRPTGAILENYCFFGWYTTVVNGNGDVYPCCMLMQAGYPPLGNIHEQPFEEIWRGVNYRRFRAELEEIALKKGKLHFHREKHRYIRQTCIDPVACDIKYVHFIGDRSFYDQYRSINESKRREGNRLKRWTSILATNLTYTRLNIRKGILSNLWKVHCFLKRK